MVPHLGSLSPPATSQTQENLPGGDQAGSSGSSAEGSAHAEPVNGAGDPLTGRVVTDEVGDFVPTRHGFTSLQSGNCGIGGRCAGTQKGPRSRTPR